MRPSHIGFCVVAICGLLLSSCSDNSIEEYTTSKSDFAAKPSPPGPGAGSAPAAPEQPHWTLPDGWSEHPGTGIRFATLHVDDGMPPLELRITPLSMAARDPLANVNRWAVQIGAPSYTAENVDEVMHEIEVEGRTMQLVNLVGPEGAEGAPSQQILSAIVPGEQSVWFFMIMGDHDRVRAQEEKFEDFMSSVHFSHEHGGDMAAAPMQNPHADPHAGIPASGSPTAGGAEGMTWTLPAHWTLQPETSQMRVATIAVDHDGQSAEVTVTKFPGDVGGMLPNINRWRRQLGMPAISSVDEQQIASREVAGSSAEFVDLVTDPNDPASQRMYVVLVPHDGMTWFLKMVGPSRFLEAQKGSYDAFIASVGFSGGTPGE
jgi:hypothetical protein